MYEYENGAYYKGRHLLAVCVHGSVYMNHTVGIDWLLKTFKSVLIDLKESDWQLK